MENRLDFTTSQVPQLTSDHLFCELTNVFLRASISCLNLKMVASSTAEAEAPDVFRTPAWMYLECAEAGSIAPPPPDSPAEDAEVGEADGVEAARKEDILESVPATLWYPDEKGV